MSGAHHHHHSHHGGHARGQPETYVADAQRVTLVSMAVNIGLSILQIIVGVWGRSQALVADGLHTLSDLLSDFLVLWASRKGAAAADADHPYGHKRIETAATLFLGAALMSVGGVLLWRAGERLQSGQGFVEVHVATLWIALLTLVAKEVLYQYMIRVAKRLRSQLLAANAWHTRSDAAVSLVGTIGIAGNLLGFTFMDTLAAALVAFMIIRIGWQLAYRALSELIDTALDAEDVEAIRQSLQATPGVVGVHELRTRRMGDQALVDAHILVDARISVSEGHYIAESARNRVLAEHDVLDVMVHIDPEDDSESRPSAGLPAREEIRRRVLGVLPGGMSPPERVVLHYLGGRVEAEVYLSANFSDAHPDGVQKIHEALEHLLKTDEIFSGIRLVELCAPK